MKRRQQSNLIYINGLPEDLVLNILSRLPIQDAVRTSVLSRKWRNAWKKLTHLVFDNKFCELSIRKTKSKLLNAIYQVLLLHHGPLHGFTLSLLSNLESSCSEIDQFVLVVLEKGVKDLTICLPKGEPYRLPSAIFSFDQQLVKLKLRYCVYKPPPGFKGYSTLVSLTLDKVGIDGSRFSSLIANCPLLERLCFKCSSNCGRLDIDTPNLELFVFEGLCESLCFKNTPKLANIEISRHDVITKDALNFVNTTTKVTLCGRLPVIKHLRLDQFYSKHMTANINTASLVNELCHVEALHLWYFCFGFLDEFVSALCLIRNSKNMASLTIEMSTKGNEQDTKFEEMVGFSDITLDRLGKVHLKHVDGFKCEMQLIELILAKSPVLKTIIIEPTYELVGDKEHRFLKELTRFRRASPFVEVLYED